jgi:signal peptidase II
MSRADQQRWGVFLPLFSIILVLDIVTKRWALGALQHGVTVFPYGDALPLTLAFNRGVAFSLHLGDASRVVFTVFTIAVVLVLLHLLRTTPEGHFLRIFSLTLVISGAIGNLIDRVRWERGVVDFLGPYDLGFMLWPIFNIADMGVTCGAVLLSIALWREDVAERDAAALVAEEPATRSS